MIKRLTALFLTVVMGLTISGCQTKKKNVADDDLPTLVWYVRYEEQPDQASVDAALDEITVRELGCHVKIKRIENGDYEQKVGLALATKSEQIDICHMAPRYNFYSLVSKNAFLPLDELLSEHGKELYKSIPEKFWDAVKVKEKIYGIPNYQIVGRMNGFVVLKDLLDKYHFDLQSVEKLDDMEPFFEAVKKGEDSSVAIFGNAKGAYTWGLMHYVGLDPIGSESYPGAVRVNDDSLTVINQFESEEFMDYCKLMHGWYEKGYMPKEGSTDNLGDLKQQGLVAAFVDNIAPGYLPNFSKQVGGRAVEGKVIDPPFVNTSNIVATMSCISKKCEHPDLAMKFLNMVNTDKFGIYNLLCYGIEGKHYKKVSENRIEKIPNSGYDPNVSWEFGNNFNAYLYGDQEDDIWEETAKINETAVVSKLLGFSLDTDPIKTELNACSAVVSEYLGSLTLGALDPEKAIPEFTKKLKDAGVDAIIKEEQRQIDEWKKTQ